MDGQQRDAPARRIQVIAGHLGCKPVSSTIPLKSEPIKSVVPKKRTDLLKWNGWGYRDSKFVVKNGILYFTGKRYPIGEIELPYFTEWVKEVFNVDIEKPNVPKDLPNPEDLPRPNLPKGFLEELENKNLDYSTEGMERLVRSHGQTLHEIYTLRLGDLNSCRIPDVVIWPVSHDQVEAIVNLAEQFGLVIIPFGGGTSVSGAVTTPGAEERPIISLDTSQMNSILWLDESNLVVCCQSGVVGQDLEAHLRAKGFTTGHEPDSYEFSTLGGWVATRASGMKKNVYGNIEDLVVGLRMVTPKGTLARDSLAPRHSTGPDLIHIALGSEGTLGVVTDVILKIRPLPRVKKYGSVVFPNFEAGVKCMREVARQRCQPASIRLMDNEQFRFGQALREQRKGVLPLITEAIKKKYLTLICRFDLSTICAATLLFEGTDEEVKEKEKRIYEIAKGAGGVPAGEKNGERGYVLTFVIAYIRDLGLEFSVVAESFETSVPWSQALNLCRNVRHVVSTTCEKLGVVYFMISHRVTQTYDSGCCIYFYFGFNWAGVTDDPVKLYEEIENDAREEILRCGGSLSHHHGVGKLRSQWYPAVVTETGASLYLAAKKHLDPNNIFAASNLLPQ